MSAHSCHVTHEGHRQTSAFIFFTRLLMDMSGSLAAKCSAMLTSSRFLERWCSRAAEAQSVQPSGLAWWEQTGRWRAASSLPLQGTKPQTALGTPLHLSASPQLHVCERYCILQLNMWSSLLYVCTIVIKDVSSAQAAAPCTCRIRHAGFSWFQLGNISGSEPAQFRLKCREWFRFRYQNRNRTSCCSLRIHSYTSLRIQHISMWSYRC